MIHRFLDEIEIVLQACPCQYHLVVVDDASNDSTPEILKNYAFHSPNLSMDVLRLNYNMGHQEAIRQGLQFVHASAAATDGIIVMDSDGEDNPAAILRLSELEDFDIVFVERGKRQENRLFKIGYFFYKRLFRTITGQEISFGNFSMISPAVLRSIAQQPFIHYASFLSKQRFRSGKIRFDRRKRINGQSKMSYRSLVFHGLYSLIEYAEEMLFTLIRLFVGLFLLLAGFTGYVLYAKFISRKAILGWASTIISSLMVSSLIIVSTIIIGLLLLSIKKTLIQKNHQFLVISKEYQLLER
ncbi:MAG: glycosyltransferase [Cytophagales bacterium]|nr:glycosyltransferase [Cytophagales bacterium]